MNPTLVRFEVQLQEAIDRRRRRRRRQARAAAAACVLSMAMGALTLLPVGDEPSRASAVELADAALMVDDGGILHIVASTSNRHPDGITTVSQTETWQQASSPYDYRTVTRGSDGSLGRELGSANGRPEVWNPRTNTVHVLALDAVVPAPSDRNAGTGPEDSRLVESIRALLRSGQAHDDGRVTIDGRPAIRIVSDIDDRVLVVDAGSYEPIEWTLRSDDGTLSTTRIETYESLPVTDENRMLASVRAQHPDAAVVVDGTISNEPGPTPRR